MYIRVVFFYVKICELLFSGLGNPIDLMFHLQPIMAITLLPLAVFIEGNDSVDLINSIAYKLSNIALEILN